MFTSCVFKGARVELGAAPYHDCTFRQCLMVIDGRAVNLENCEFENCSWTFEGPAATAMMMLQMICHNEPGVAAQTGIALGILPGDSTKH